MILECVRDCDLGAFGATGMLLSGQGSHPKEWSGRNRSWKRLERAAYGPPFFKCLYWVHKVWHECRIGTALKMLGLPATLKHTITAQEAVFHFQEGCHETTTADAQGGFRAEDHSLL